MNLEYVLEIKESKEKLRFGLDITTSAEQELLCWSVYSMVFTM